jgi:hypothetical protein
MTESSMHPSVLSESSWRIASRIPSLHFNICFLARCSSVSGLIFSRLEQIFKKKKKDKPLSQIVTMSQLTCDLFFFHFFFVVGGGGRVLRATINLRSIDALQDLEQEYKSNGKTNYFSPFNIKFTCIKNIEIEI